MKDDQEGAIDLLQADRSLAWVRDDVSNAYPLHIAAWRVRSVLLLGDKCKSYPPYPMSVLDKMSCKTPLASLLSQIRSECTVMMHDSE